MSPDVASGDANKSYAQRIVADVRRAAAATPDGRLPLPDMADWDIFPFEGDMKVKVIDELVVPEPARDGELGPDGCFSCATDDSECTWVNDKWRLKADAPNGLPVALLLTPRAHYDLTDLPPDLAVEMGPMLQRVERAMLALGDIGRVHINRWGDGGAHLHWWFLARPLGLMQLRGSFSSLWMDVLPPRPISEWEKTNQAIGVAMRAGDSAWAMESAAR